MKPLLKESERERNKIGGWMKRKKSEVRAGKDRHTIKRKFIIKKKGCIENMN